MQTMWEGAENTQSDARIQYADKGKSDVNEGEKGYSRPDV